MQSEHFVVLFFTIQIQTKQRLDIYFVFSKHENTLKYLQYT